MESESPQEEEKQNSQIIPRILWLRILVVVFTMVLAYYTSFLVEPSANLLNVDLKDMNGFGFTITAGVLAITFGYAISQFLLIFLVNLFFHKRPFRLLGFRGPVLMPMAIGVLIGFLFTGTYYILLGSIGGNFSIRWTVPADAPVLSVIFHTFFVLIFILTINSLKEELVFRVYPLEQFMDKPKAMALVIVLVSIFFSVIHAMYLPFSLNAFVQRFLIALLFSFAYYHWRSIWFISGIHTGANIVPFLFFSGRWRVGGLWQVSFSGTTDTVRIASYCVVIGITMWIIYQIRPQKRPEGLISNEGRAES